MPGNANQSAKRQKGQKVRLHPVPVSGQPLEMLVENSSQS